MATSSSSTSALSFDSEHRLRSENLAWDIDVWYPLIQDFTFESIFLPLKAAEATAIRTFHDVSWRNALLFLPEEHIIVLKNLECDITNLLQTWTPAKRVGVFMRLCGRSPKDGE